MSQKNATSMSCVESRVYLVVKGILSDGKSLANEETIVLWCGEISHYGSELSFLFLLLLDFFSFLLFYFLF